MLERLQAIMAALRHPETGCPWDLEQDARSIVPYTLEEAYEVADAVERGAPDEIKDELGDLLFQVVFLARLAEEQGEFDLNDVVSAISDKLIRRHPHVFGAQADGPAPDVQAVGERWEAIKAAERAKRTGDEAPSGYLDNIPVTLPALQRAQKIGQRARRAGFDWPDVRGVFAKVREELGELDAALAVQPPNAAAVRAEAGDVLMAAVSLCRHTDVNAEQALREANSRFEQRFVTMERLAAAAGTDLADLNDAALDTLWERAKQA